MKEAEKTPCKTQYLTFKSRIKKNYFTFTVKIVSGQTQYTKIHTIDQIGAVKR